MLRRIPENIPPRPEDGGEYGLRVDGSTGEVKFVPLEDDVESCFDYGVPSDRDLDEIDNGVGGVLETGDDDDVGLEDVNWGDTDDLGLEELEKALDDFVEKNKTAIFYNDRLCLAGRQGFEPWVELYDPTNA